MAQPLAALFELRQRLRIGTCCIAFKLTLLCHKRRHLLALPQQEHCPSRAFSSSLKRWRSGVIEWSTCRCARRITAGDAILGKGMHLAFDEVLLTTDWLVGIESLAYRNPQAAILRLAWWWNPRQLRPS